LIVAVDNEQDPSPDIVTGVTYGGIPMTLIQKINASQNGNDETYLFALVAPPTGTNNVSITTSATVSGMVSEAADYDNVAQTLPTNIVSNTVTGQTGFSVGPITTGADSWITGAIGNTSGTVAISAGASIRDNTNTSHVLIDSNATTGGTATVSANEPFSFSAWLGIITELQPAH